GSRVHGRVRVGRTGRPAPLGRPRGPAAHRVDPHSTAHRAGWQRAVRPGRGDHAVPLREPRRRRAAALRRLDGRPGSARRDPLRRLEERAERAAARAARRMGRQRSGAALLGGGRWPAGAARQPVPARARGGTAMKSAALSIGVDEYADRPLTSAANDAMAFREASLELDMVDENQVTLLTTPARHPTARDATRRNIKTEIDRFYRSGEQYDRLFFFFAGHGLLAYRDGGRAILHTAILPADVEDLRRDGDLLIDVDELLDVMGLAGPRDQFYFIDACRDLPYDTHPNVGGLGLTGEQPGYARSL